MLIRGNSLKDDKEAQAGLEELRQQFEAIDEDQSGLVSAAELAKAMKSVHLQADAALDASAVFRLVEGGDDLGVLAERQLGLCVAQLIHGAADAQEHVSDDPCEGE